MNPVLASISTLTLAIALAAGPARAADAPDAAKVAKALAFIEHEAHWAPSEGDLLKRGAIALKRRFPDSGDVATVHDVPSLLALASACGAGQPDWTPRDLAIRALAEALDDPQADFIPASPRVAHASYNTEVGIGVNVRLDKAGLRIISAFEDTPAFKAGLATGDVLTTVDGTELAGMSFHDAISRVRGEVGSHVVLGLTSRWKPLKRTAALVRTNLPSLDAVSTSALGGGIGYVRFASFTEAYGLLTFFQATRAELRKAILARHQDRYLVLDLRGNSMGELFWADFVSSFFIAAGPSSFVQGHQGLATCSTGTEPEDPPMPLIPLDRPLVVLVDAGTSGPAELLAGALRAGRHAQLLGEPTAGATISRSSMTFAAEEDSGTLFVGHEIHLPLDRHDIHGVGLMPDVRVASQGPLFAKDGHRLTVRECLALGLDSQVAAARALLAQKKR